VSRPSTPFPTNASGTRRVAFAGAGFIAAAHAEALRGEAGIAIVAVCDPDIDRARALARRFGIPRAVGSIEDLSSADVDLVHLLVPPDRHEELARRLLERGIGVFLEKPLALSAKAAAELLDLARERGLPLGVNHNFVFHPAFARLLDRVRSGEIGRVDHVQATLAAPLAQLEAGAFGHWMFQAPANIVYEQAVHPLSLVQALVGRAQNVRPAVLSSRELAPGQVFHDRWSVAARAGDATVDVHLAFGAGFERFRVEVRGSDGFLEADLRRNTLSGERKSVWLEFFDAFLAASRRGAALRREARRGLSGYLLSTLGWAPRRDAFFLGMQRSILDFHRSIGRSTGRPGSDAVETLEWCDAVAAAATRAPPAAQAASPGAARTGEVAVLGASGFIGRRTVAKLLQRGLPVTALLRGTRFPPAEIATGVGNGRVRLFRARLEDPRSLAAALAGAKVVLHLATGGGDTWEEVSRAMVRGSVEAAQIALEAGVRRFVYVSSISALDTGGRSPIEDSTATDPDPEQRSLYARGKIAAEEALRDFSRGSGLPLVIVRPGVVLGSGSAFQHSGLGLWVRDNHCVAFGAGDHPLPLVWVDDVADALAAIAAHPGPELDGRALNLAARVPLGARDIVAELRVATGRDLHFHARSLGLSYALEIGKWIVKRIGGRSTERPSWKDLRARALHAPIPSRTAREVLGWTPIEEREAFLDRAVRVHGPRST